MDDVKNVEDMKLQVALVQFARGAETSKNLERMVCILSKIKGTDVVCLPEAWLGKGIMEEDDAESICTPLGEVAKRGGFYILLGGLLLRRGGEVYGTCHVINSEGKLKGFSDKCFPSVALGEREFCSLGKALPVFTVKQAKVGVVVCVDALYPEVARSLALRGADVIFNPSNIPENRVEMWKHVAVTRAVENTVFYAFVNNTSTLYPDGRMVSGNSFVVSPEGEIISQANSSETCLKVELDLSLIGRVRSRWPFLLDTRRGVNTGLRKLLTLCY